VKKIAKNYKLSYLDALRYCELVESVLEVLMRLGIKVDIENHFKFIHDWTKFEKGNVFKSEQFVKNALYNSGKFYFYNEIAFYQVRLKNKNDGKNDSTQAESDTIWKESFS
jgi:hypothetical protein